MQFCSILELVKSGMTALHHVPTGAMVADVGTKYMANSALRSIMHQMISPVFTRRLHPPGVSVFSVVSLDYSLQ